MRHRVAAFLVSSILVAATATAKPVALIFASSTPPAHSISKVMQPWLNSLAEASNGELKISWYPGGQLAKASGSLDSISTGLVDGGYVVDTYTPSALPNLVTVAKNSLFGEDSMVMTGAANEYLLLSCPQCRQDWENNGVIAMAYVSTTSYNLQCTGLYDSTAKLADKKIRSTGYLQGLARALGGTPVNIPLSDSFDALQRGQVDCSISSDSQLKDYTLNEVVKYVINTPLGVYMNGAPFVINRAKWQSLSPQHKQLILARLPGLVADVSHSYEEHDIEARKVSAAMGVKWFPADPSLADARNRYLGTVMTSAEQEAKVLRLRGIRETMERFSPIHEKWKKIVADIGHDKEKFKEALVREVYSKVSF